jgi:hypothetical protein
MILARILEHKKAELRHKQAEDIWPILKRKSATPPAHWDFQSLSMPPEAP